MPDLVAVPRHMLMKKPRHGAACNRCGLCCHAVLCDVGMALFRRRQGPCPALSFDENGSRCGVVDNAEGEAREAALLLINSGQGCDMLLRDERRDIDYSHRQNTRDRKNRDRLKAARKLFGIT